MTMTVVFHDNARTTSWLVVVNDDEVCSQILSIEDFFGEFASSSFDEKEGFDGGIFVIDEQLIIRVAQLLVSGKDDFADDGLAVGNLSEIREGVFDGVGEGCFGTAGSVDLES